MTRMLNALGPAVVIFIAAAPALALAQSNSPAWNMSMPLAGASRTAATLGPWDIIAGVRRAGFEPISRPVQRGRVYVLLALDQDNVDVRLAVDAGSGRVLWAGEVAGVPYVGMPYNGPAYYGNRAWPRYERLPMPPARMPSTRLDRTNFGPVRSSTSARRSAPLPRSRPADVAGAVANEASAGAQRDPKAAAAGQSHVAPAPAASPAKPTMVPVAPLE